MNAVAARYLPALLLILGTAAMAQSEIYRCAQEDGTVAFQQTPCAVAEDSSSKDSAASGAGEPDDTDAAASSESAPDVNDPFEVPAEAEASAAAESTAPLAEDRAGCEKSARDAIDAIDLEMRKSYSQEQGQAYREELLVLTQQLRDCKKVP